MVICEQKYQRTQIGHHLSKRPGKVNFHGSFHPCLSVLFSVNLYQDKAGCAEGKKTSPEKSYMPESIHCSYPDCTRQAWRPVEGDKPFCIFHSPRIEEKIEEFTHAWESFLDEHQNDEGHLVNLDCRGFIFTMEIHFSMKTFSGTVDFENARFSGNAYFSHAQFPEGAYFENAMFLGNASFIYAQFSGYADFMNAQFSGKALFLDSVITKKGSFGGAVFTGVNLSGSTFTNCSFENVVYNTHTKLSLQKPPSLGQFWKKIKRIPPTNFIGIETEGIIAASNRRFVRDIHDQQYINQLRERNRFNKYFWYPVWYLTCDCGRSFFLFFLWCLLIAAAFGKLYLWNAEAWFPEPWKWSALTPFYYSLVTFSTLGFGDVTPRLNCWFAQLAVMVEVFLGYIGLGGLISIFANKLARRA